MNAEVVTRLEKAIVEELRRRGGPDVPLKVSQLYREIVPYQAVRARIGVELNADYEHALLRLLAGERDLLRLEPKTARDELRKEVEAPYPFVGLFRKFSASDVWVNMPSEPDAEASAQQDFLDEAPHPPPGPGGPKAAPRRSGDEVTAPARVAAELDSVRLSSGGPRPLAEDAPVRLHSEEQDAGRVAAGPKPCPFCDEGLPQGRRVRFCPYCGGDQRLRPCPRCQVVLEQDWRFCISCGFEAGS